MTERERKGAVNTCLALRPAAAQLSSTFQVTMETVLQRVTFLFLHRTIKQARGGIEPIPHYWPCRGGAGKPETEREEGKE